MPWSNGPMTVYHGTDDLSANRIRLGGLDPNPTNDKRDFGKGFYVTTSLHQAQQWANQHSRRKKRYPEVLEYRLHRDAIEGLSHLTFTMATADFYDFVDYCRQGHANHGPHPRAAAYEVVYGPVRLGQQRIVLANSDQILFSNPLNIRDPDGQGRDFALPVRSHRPAAPNRFF